MPAGEKNIIQEFIEALHDEITYVRKSKGKSYFLSHGSLQKNLGAYYIYAFHSHRPFATADDTPARLEIEDIQYDCTVVTSQGLELEIAVTTHLGERVPAARLTGNHGDLLNRLADKLEQAKRDRGDTFNLARDVFIGRTRPLSGVPAGGGKGAGNAFPSSSPSLSPSPIPSPYHSFSPAHSSAAGADSAASLAGDPASSAGTAGGGNADYPSYTFQAENPPNNSQKLAILNSFNNSLAVIWGPPGTGKTITIARAVEAHLNAGRRVLLVAHANAAVDAALIEIASQVKDSYYEEGKLLRLGMPKDKILGERFPLVLADYQIARSTASLQAELSQLESSIRSLETRIYNCDRLLVVVDKVKQLERKIQRPEESPAGKMQQKQKQLLSEIEQAEIQLAAAQHHLKSMIGQAVYLYENIVKDLNIFISVRRNMIEELDKKIAGLGGGQSSEAALEAAYEELDKMMAETGLDPNEAVKSKTESKKILDGLQAKAAPIKKQIIEAHGKVTQGARLIATTLSRVFCATTLEKEKFDILVCDEASMVPMPSLFWALGKVTMGATIVGDFKQLPPICISKSDMAEKWLKRSIFDELRIASVEAARKNARVSILDTQYRMTGKITDITNQLFYGGLLRKANALDEQAVNDTISGEHALTIVDTSAVNHHCTQPPEGSRVNIYSAGLCATLCRKLLVEHPAAIIGIATPYRAQADLIEEILIDTDLQGRVKVSTVHKFQGGQATIMIFDCVDGLGSGHSMLDDRYKDSTAEVLLNVALTRAREKFFLVVNKNYFFSSMSAESLILQFIAALGANGTRIDARSVDDNYTARSIEADASQRATKESSTPGSLFNEKNFWDAFFADLASASRTITIVSPFLTAKRSRVLVPKLEEVLARGVKVMVYTKPPAEHSQSYMSDDAIQVISMLEKMGVRVVQQSDIHQKVAIIDDHICWEGSLNIFSHTGSTLEHMRRLAGSATAAEIRGNLRL